MPRPGAGPPSRQKPAPLPPAGNAPQPGSSQQIQQRISVPPSPTYPPAGPPAFPTADGKPELPLTVAIRPFLPDKGSRPQSPRKGPQTVNSSSIYSMYLQQATPPKNYQPPAHGTLNKSVKAGMLAVHSEMEDHCMLLRVKHNSYLKYRVSVWDEKGDKMQNSFAGESHPDFLPGARISLSSEYIT